MRVALIILLLIILGACSSTFELMPPPTFVSTPSFANAAGNYYRRIDASPELGILYATDRKPSANRGAACDYDSKRGDRLRLGSARIVVGNAKWSMAELTAKSLAGKKIEVECVKTSEIGALYTTIPPTESRSSASSSSDADLVKAPSQAFADEVNRELRRTGAEDLYIFVTGLNTNFKNSVEHAGSLHHYLGHRGVMIAYPWPVRPTPFAVNRDRLSGRVSARALRELIVFLGAETEAQRINLIGYSGGAEVLAVALYQLRLSRASDSEEQIASELKVGQVVLASPDMDYFEFRHMLMDGLQDIARHITVYVNQKDDVLKYSRLLSTGSARLGNTGIIVDEVERNFYRNSHKISFVNPVNSERIVGVSDSLGHGYWYKNPWVSSDVLISLATGLLPAARGLVRSEEDLAWNFPDDYPHRTNLLFSELLTNEMAQLNAPAEGAVEPVL